MANRLLTAAIALLCALPLQAAAFTPNDFARLPNIRDLDLSPDGHYFSAIYLTPDGRPTLAIQDLQGGAKPYLVRSGTWQFNWTRWISDSVLLASVNTPMTMDGTPVSVTRLIVVDAKAGSASLMFGREQRRAFIQIQDGFIGVSSSKPDHILIEGSAVNPATPAVKLVKIGATRLPKRNHQNPRKNVKDWSADALGQVRAGRGYTRDQERPFLMLKDAQDRWHDHSSLYDQNCSLTGLPTHDSNQVYVQCPSQDGFGQVFEFDVRTGKLGRFVAGRPHTDVSSIALSNDGSEIDAIYYESESVPTEYRQPTLKALKALARKHFPDSDTWLETWTDDYGKAIIGAQSDVLPPHYYLYDGEAQRVDYLTSAYPDLMDGAPGRMFAVTYTARDGLEIPAYVTLPQGRTLDEAPSLPFVVYPHGGPHARSYYGFDWTVQMLASQGYGVLQMNFRGSTGYGQAFQRAGEKQWGQAMQDDVTDGTRWLVESGLADPDRICLLGGSYGGYAALMGSVREPELYQCAASLNGVTDLPALLRNSQKYIGGRFMTRHIGKLWSDRKMLRANSPRHRAEEIRIPVLLVHGEKDRVVDVSQSRRMASAIRDEFLWRFVELEDGDHYLSRQNNRQLFASTLLSFLDAHLH